MGFEKIEIPQFDGKFDFRTWSMKMRALLSSDDVEIAMKKESKCDDGQKKRKAKILKGTMNLFILSKFDNVWREATSCKSLEIWNKLEELHANELTPNLAYVKVALYTYKMDSFKSVDDNEDELLKIKLLLRDTPHAIDDTSTVMILMNALPDNYQVVKNIFQYFGLVPSLELKALKANNVT